MADYAIGDVQGCHEQLLALLEAIAFDPGRDRLWLVGDVVNRGPRSLEVLRLVRSLGERALMVLGNHDLHLLAAAAGARAPRRKDTLGGVLAAPDRADLIEWLRHRPLLVRDAAGARLMVHAGLASEWSADDAAGLAGELEQVLRGPRWLEFFPKMYGDLPRRWSPSLEGWDRYRFITNAFTRMRYLGPDGALDLQEKRPPGAAPAGLVPWFAFPGRRSTDTTIVFGHWATLRTVADVDPVHRVRHVDTGCVWGGSLTALRLDDDVQTHVPGLPRRGARRP